MAPPRTDLLIAGGGLAGGLIALALAQRRPDIAVTLVEGGERLGGNHIWSFFDSDVAVADRALVEPLIVHRWEGHDVAFPARCRTLPGGYNSIESERFDAVVRAALPSERILTFSPIAALDPAGATLTDGTRIEAQGVIDARGSGALGQLDLGWQKFLGRLLRLAEPHGLTRPTIMDATVDQAEGYRFVYLLPFDDRRVFVEDTYYSEEAGFDRATLGARIDAYAAARGWQVETVEREEAAALPIAMGGDFEAYWQAGGEGVAKVGMAAALFQPMTGYSLPDAVRTAALIAGMADLSSPALAAVLHDHTRRTWDERGFYRLLARLLFRAAEPRERYRLLERFYGLDDKLIGRFYAGRSTLFDKARVLAGKPPVPIARALPQLKEKR